MPKYYRRAIEVAAVIVAFAGLIALSRYFDNVGSPEKSKAKYEAQVELYRQMYGGYPQLRGVTRGQTHLYLAAQQGLDAVVAKLIELGEDPNVRSVRGMPALAGANYACAKILIEAGADVNVRWVMHTQSGSGGILTVMELQPAIHWHRLYGYMSQPEEDAIKKIQLLLDNDAKLVRGIDFYKTLALNAGNYKIAAFLEELERKKDG